MKPWMRKAIGLLAAAILFLPARAVRGQVYSHARVVRLSYVEGTVAVQRPDAPGWASAPVNTPIQEGFQISTAEDSFAEVEFENSSTARLGQDSLLEFPQLALEPGGGKLNRLVLRQGYATFDFIPERGDQDQVEAGAATITLASGKAARFRADLDEDAVRLEVFQGQVEVSSIFGAQTLDRDMVMVMRPGGNPPVDVTRGITQDAWDQWVNKREEQATAARNWPVPGIYSPNVNWLYGWGDLYNYGDWAYLPGYGYGWSPFVGAGWTPYSYGRWGWYPGFGFTWISFEPWGWLPFHYGGWIFQPGIGWCWIPGALGFWSPALVTWYQGPGWIGWTPRPPQNGTHNRPSANNPCPQGQACLTAVSTQAFQDGEPVLRHRMTGVHVGSGVEIARPEIQPSRLGMMAGSPYPARGVTRFGEQAGAASAAASSTAQAPAAVAAPRPGQAAAARPGSADFGPRTERPSSLVFDASESRYVNNPNAPSAPARGNSSPVAGPASSSAANSEGMARGGPAVAGPSGGANFERGHGAGPRSGLIRQDSAGGQASSSMNFGGRPAEGHFGSPGTRSTAASERSFGPSPAPRSGLIRQDGSGRHAGPSMNSGGRSAEGHWESPGTRSTPASERSFGPSSAPRSAGGSPGFGAERPSGGMGEGSFGPRSAAPAAGGSASGHVTSSDHPH